MKNIILLSFINVIFALNSYAEPAPVELLKKAEQGNSEAIFKVAMHYNDSFDDEDKPLAAKYCKKAFNIYSKSAENNDSNALFKLGEIYSWGCGNIEENDKLTIEYYKSAADKNSGDAVRALAREYETGARVKKDIEKSIELYKKAIELRNKQASLDLYYLYDLKKEYIEAKNVLLKFVKQEDSSDETAEALNKLAWYYYMGNDEIIRDFNKAYRYFLQSAKYKNQNSQEQLAWIYQNGHGTQKSNVKAYIWYNIANIQYSSNSIKSKLKSLEKLMSSKQIEEANKTITRYSKLYIKNN